jgi:DNA-binding transcriptional ArsR family regulator
MEKELFINKIGDDGQTAVPNDLFEKYKGVFNEEQNKAVIDLIQQTYAIGLSLGRNESPLYAIIPIDIMENKTLSANSKLLYGEIMALAKKSGKCYATNEHLADILGLSKSSIPNLLRELSGIGLVTVDIQRSSRGTYRNIMVSFFNNGGYSGTTTGGIVKEQGQKRNKQTEIDKVDNTCNSKELQEQIVSLINY